MNHPEKGECCENCCKLTGAHKGACDCINPACPCHQSAEKKCICNETNPIRKVLCPAHGVIEYQSAEKVEMPEVIKRALENGDAVCAPTTGTSDQKQKTYRTPLEDQVATDTSDWRERFDKFLLGDFKDGLHVPRTRDEWIVFIERELEQAREEGRQEADWMGESLKGAYEAGRAAERASVREMIEGMKKEEIQPNVDGQIAFSKTMRTRGYNAALQDFLTRLGANNN